MNDINKNELRDLLERLLWSRSNLVGCPCPDCQQNFTKYGHLSNCQLANMLVLLGNKHQKFQK